MTSRKISEKKENRSQLALFFSLSSLLFQVCPHVHAHLGPYKHNLAESPHPGWRTCITGTSTNTHLGFGNNCRRCWHRDCGYVLGKTKRSDQVGCGGGCVTVAHEITLWRIIWYAGTCTHADGYITIMCQLIKWSWQPCDRLTQQLASPPVQYHCGHRTHQSHRTTKCDSFL